MIPETLDFGFNNQRFAAIADQEKAARMSSIFFFQTKTMSGFVIGINL